MSEIEKARYQQYFDRFATDGLLDKEGFKRVLQCLGADPPQCVVDEIFAEHDKDENSQLNQEEFHEWIQDRIKSKPEMRDSLMDSLNILFPGQDSVNIDELLEKLSELGEQFDETERTYARMMLTQFDSNKDGAIAKTELRDCFYSDDDQIDAGNQEMEESKEEDGNQVTAEEETEETQEVTEENREVTEETQEGTEETQEVTEENQEVTEEKQEEIEENQEVIEENQEVTEENQEVKEETEEKADENQEVTEETQEVTEENQEVVEEKQEEKEENQEKTEEVTEENQEATEETEEKAEENQEVTEETKETTEDAKENTTETDGNQTTVDESQQEIQDGNQPTDDTQETKKN